MTTPVCGVAWFVRVLPGAFDVAISAAGAPFLGVPDIIGKAAVVDYPRTPDGEVDMTALAGEAFAAALTDVIRAKAAEIVEAA